MAAALSVWGKAKSSCRNKRMATASGMDFNARTASDNWSSSPRSPSFSRLSASARVSSSSRVSKVHVRPASAQRPQIGLCPSHYVRKTIRSAKSPLAAYFSNGVTEKKEEVRV